MFAQLPVFTVIKLYGLSLRSILLPGGQTDVALGQDGIYCIDSRVSELGRNALVENGAYFLTFKRHADHVDGRYYYRSTKGTFIGCSQMLN